MEEQWRVSTILISWCRGRTVGLTSQLNILIEGRKIIHYFKHKKYFFSKQRNKGNLIIQECEGLVSKVSSLPSPDLFFPVIEQNRKIGSDSK